MKVINKVLFAVLTFTFLSAAQAGDSVATLGDGKADCVSKAEMQTIAQHFSQFKEQANADYCYDGSHVSNLISSIMFMRKTTFSKMTPSKDELFTGRFASSWWDYFIGRIDTLEIVDNCPKGVVAYVYGFGLRTMFACPMALTDQFSSLDRSSVFMHEARHIDGYPHVTCSKGPRQGIQGACDNRISDGGSYAVTVETYAQLAKFAEGLHPALKAYSRNAAAIYADEAFETPARVARTENLLLLTSALDFHSYNVRTNSVEKLGKAYAAGHMVRRSQHMVMIPTDKNLKAQYIFARNEGEIPQSPSDLITEYNAQTPTEKANLVDLHIGAQWTARVYKNSIRFACDPKSPATTDLQIPNGQASSNLLYPNGYDRAAMVANLVTTTGEMYDISCAGKTASIKASQLKLDQRYTRMYKADGQVFGLTSTGNLYKLDAGRSAPVVTALDGSIIEIMPQQSFEFFETN